MKILVFDIGGTSIKHGYCIDNVLESVQETPTDAKKGGRHVIDTVISLIKEQEGYDAIGISTAGQVNAEKGSITIGKDADLVLFDGDINIAMTIVEGRTVYVA